MTCTARTGPLRQSISWGMFSANFRTFSRSPSMILYVLVDALRDFGRGRKSYCHVQTAPYQSHPGQESGGHLGPVSSGWSDPALDFSVLEPAVVLPKTSGGVRITVNYKKLSQISNFSQLQIPRVDHVLDSVRKERLFFLFDLVSLFHPITVRNDTVPLPASLTLLRASTSGSPCPKEAELRPAGTSGSSK